MREGIVEEWGVGGVAEVVAFGRGGYFCLFIDLCISLHSLFVYTTPAKGLFAVASFYRFIFSLVYLCTSASNLSDV